MARPGQGGIPLSVPILGQQAGQPAAGQPPSGTIMVEIMRDGQKMTLPTQIAQLFFLDDILKALNKLLELAGDPEPLAAQEAQEAELLEEADGEPGTAG